MKTVKQKIDYYFAQFENQAEATKIKDNIMQILEEWLTQKQHPVENMQRRNNVKALLVLQGKQQMLNEIIKELTT